MQTLSYWYWMLRFRLCTFVAILRSKDIRQEWREGRFVMAMPNVPGDSIMSRGQVMAACRMLGIPFDEFMNEEKGSS